MANDEEVNIKITGQNEAGNAMKGATDDLSGVANKSEDVSANFKKVGLAIGAVGVGITAYAKNATDFTVQLTSDTKQLSRETGLAYNEASSLLYVTGRLGISADQTSTTFGILSKKINEAGNNSDANRIAMEGLQIQIEKTKKEITDTNTQITKSGDKTGDLTLKVKGLNNTLANLNDQLSATSNPLDQLNIVTKKADGTMKSFNDILLEVADKFKGMEDGPTKTALAMELFGRSGKDMIKVLNLGSEGISQMEQKAKDLGLTLTTENVVAVTKYIQSTKDLTDSTNALKLAVGQETTPVLAAFNGHVNNLVQKLLESDGALKTVTVDTLAFGGPILTTGGALLGFAANIAQVVSGANDLKAAAVGARAAILTMSTVSLAAWGAGIILIVNQVKNTILATADAVNNAWNAATSFDNSAQIRKLQQQATAARALGDTAQVNKLANAIAALGGGRAKGGPVSAGTAYPVGENPDGSWNNTTELFVPSQSGTIIPAAQARDVMGGGGGSVENHFHAPLYLNTAEAVREVLAIIDRNSQLAGGGLSVRR